MKPHPKPSAGADLDHVLERLAELEHRADRAAVVALDHNGRLTAVETRLDMDAGPAIEGFTISTFAKRVCRSRSAVRKMIAQNRLPLLLRLGVHPIIRADAELPPRRRPR
jgi:hypothetical protein